MALSRTRGRGDRDVATAPAVGSDAYTGILAISLIALIIGSVFLYLDYTQYGTKEAPKPQPFKLDKAPPGGGAGGAVAPAPVAPVAPPAGGAATPPGK